MTSLLLLGLMALPLQAQREPAWPRTPANCAVEGQVVNSLTGEPVPGATVTLRDTRAWRTRDGSIAITSTNVGVPGVTPAEDLRTVAADANGKFTFTALSPGIYTLAALKDGFLLSPYNPYLPANSHSGGTIQLEPGKQAGNLTIRLRPETVLSGRVLGGSGKPLAAVCVKLAKSEAAMPGMQFIEYATAWTNERGEYTLRGFPPDKYFLLAMPPSAYVPQFYPDSPTLESARPIEVGVGEHRRDLDFTLRPGVVPVVIRGSIEIPADATQSSIDVFSPQFGAVEGVTLGLTGRTTTFQTPSLLPGSYWVHAWLMRNGVRHEEWRNVDVGPDGVAGLVLRPAPPVDLRGRVELEGKPGVPLSRMKLLLDNSYSVGFDIGHNANGIPIPVADDGTFTVKNVPAATYRIVSRYALGGYLRAVRVGGAELAGTELDLRRGAPSGDLDILINPGGGAIQGDVLDEQGKPAAGALIALLPAIPQTDPQRIRESTTLTFPDLQGRFLFLGIPPGNYRLLAWKLGVADGKTVLYDPEFVKKYEGRAKAIRLGPNARETIHLDALQ